MSKTSQKYRIETDKLQVVSNQLADAICLYFGRAHPATILNLVHASHSIIKNLSDFYTKLGAISSGTLWSEGIDDTAVRKILNRKKDRGDKGFLIDYGNFVKHADSDSDNAVLISSQLAYVYLYAAIVDFLVLKDALVQASVAQKVKEYKWKWGLENSLVDFMTEPFRSHLPIGFFREKVPRIDALAGIFLDWKRIVENEKLVQIPNLSATFCAQAVPISLDSSTTGKIIWSLSEGTMSAFDMPLSKIFEGCVSLISKKPFLSEEEKAHFKRRIHEFTRLFSAKYVYRFIDKQELGYGGRCSGYFLKAVSVSEKPYQKIPDIAVVLDPATEYRVDVRDLGVDFIK